MVLQTLADRACRLHELVDLVVFEENLFLEVGNLDPMTGTTSKVDLL